MKSNIKYRGNGHSLSLFSAYTAFSTRTAGDPITYCAKCNIEISGFIIDATNHEGLQDEQSFGPGNYSGINLGCAKNVFIHDCLFHGWWGTAIIISFIYGSDNQTHSVATAENIIIEKCQFSIDTDASGIPVESQIKRVGNGITISNGNHIQISDCNFYGIDTTAQGGTCWPGPIDIEAECGGATFDHILVQRCHFIRCGALGAVNMANNTTVTSSSLPTIGSINVMDNVIESPKYGLSISSFKANNLASSSIVFKGNTITDIAQVGIRFQYSLVNVSVPSCSFQTSQADSVKEQVSDNGNSLYVKTGTTFSGFSR